MKYLFLLFLVSCAGSGRILSKEERASMGLNGVIYDARICDSKFDPVTKKHMLEKDCETVTCEREGREIVCRARKER